MNIGLLLYSLLIVGISMYVIKYGCDSFGDASEHLGKKVYRMKPGIRGATIEAVASSLPELFTATFLLFLFHDMDGFSAAIATCAGSALFNAAVIPGVCILAVTLKGVDGEPVDRVPLLRKVILRDGIFFLLAEGALIYFLGNTVLVWWMGAALIGIYLVYFSFLKRGFGAEDEKYDEDNEDETQSGEGTNEKGLIGNILTFDYNRLFFEGKDFTKVSAWIVLSLSTITIAVACYFLADAVILSATALNVPAYFTAVILGAAATSVPDTFISYKDAMRGDYDDAVANAVGSNIFDICVALGLPLLAYGLIYGDVNLSGGADDSSNIQELRIALVVMTFVILGLLFASKSTKNSDQEPLLNVGSFHGWVLCSLYGVWTLFIVGRSMEWPWVTMVLG